MSRAPRGTDPRDGDGVRPQRGARQGRGRGSSSTSQVARDRQASAADRDERLYERRRATQSRRRVAADEAAFDPAPPGDEDWTVEVDQSDALRRVAPPTTLDQTLRELVRRRGWEERLRGASAWSRWDAIVGTELAARCEPVRLVRGVLTIRAESQVWATQLRYLVTRLQVNVNEHLGAGSVREVRIVVGALEGRDAPDVED
jgi:predicted nucleic acid-binding Zn ribbon protein